MHGVLYHDSKLKKLFAILVLASISCAIPAMAQEQTNLEATSDQGTFLIKVLWTHDELGRDNSFSITFIEPETGSVLEDIQYDLVVLQGDGNALILRKVDQISADQKVMFDEPGSYMLVIGDIEGLGEDASFSVEVTPEFPTGVVGAVVAGTVAAIIAARHSSKSLFSQ